MIRRLKRHQILRLQGEPTGDYIEVHEGLLALTKPLPGHGRRVVALAFPGDILSPFHNCGVEALENTACAPVSIDDFDVEARLARDTRIAYEWAVRDAQSSGARVAHILCEIHARAGYSDGAPLRVPTQHQLADITGQTSVNVCRVLGALENDGLIERSSSSARLVMITDHRGLARVAGFNAGYLAG